MAEALEIILAELAIKDLSTKDLKKIDKALSRTKKNIKSTEKSTGKLSKTFGRLKSPGLQRAGRGVRRVGRGVRRGIGGLTGGFGGIPIIGGAIAAAMAAMSSTRARFVAGVSLKKELTKLSNDFRAAFGKQAKKVLRIAKKEGNFFRKDDFRAGFTALRDAGIDPKSITKNITDITQFAKAQGFIGPTAVTEATQALIAGRIKAGRGLGITQIKQIEALARFTQDVASADIAFQRIIGILKSASPELERFAKATKINTQSIVHQANKVKTMTETTTLLGRVTKNAAGKFISLQSVFEKTEKNQRIVNAATAKLAKETSGVVSTLIGFVPKIVTGAETVFKGVKKVSKTIFDIFFPAAGLLEKLKPAKKVGKVSLLGGLFGAGPRPLPQKLPPTQKLPVTQKLPPKLPPTSKQQGMAININVNITAPTDQIGSSVAKEIRKTLNLLARTTFRHNTGLILSG